MHPTATLMVAATYVAVAAFKLTMLHNNPAFLATAGIFAGWVVVGLGILFGRVRATQTAAGV